MAFVPRLSTTSPTDMSNNPWWYSTAINPYLGWYNRFNNSGYGLPNCTCYAYGRYAEIQNGWDESMLPRGDAGTWWGQATDPNSSFYIGAGNFGQEPQLGAVFCWYNPSEPDVGGHVAIVEAIHYNADNTVNYISTSNSAYNGTYFWVEEYIYRYNSDYPNDPYHINYHSNAYRTQGFLYQRNQPTPTPTRRHKMPLWMMLPHFI